jgi:fermentation-respiration switch protein FrsA (DUF1100 family)
MPTRRDVTFSSRGLALSGWLFLPDGPSPLGGRPAVALAHGLSCVKEQGLEHVAGRFAAAGLAALAFDFRTFGASAGEPRGQAFPLEQAEDYRSAIGWLAAQPGVDPERIGVWGTSLSGGVVLHLAACDRRVKAVAAQVPSLLTSGNCRFLQPGPEGAVAALLRSEDALRRRDGVAPCVPVVATAGEPCMFADDECRRGYADMAVPAWRNAVTVESLERLQAFDAAARIERIAPTPLLLIGAEKDTLIPADLTRQAFARAGEPKDLVLLSCGHFDVYAEPWRGRATETAAQWLARVLREGPPSLTGRRD